MLFSAASTNSSSTAVRKIESGLVCWKMPNDEEETTAGLFAVVVKRCLIGGVGIAGGVILVARAGVEADRAPGAAAEATTPMSSERSVLLPFS